MIVPTRKQQKRKNSQRSGARERIRYVQRVATMDGYITTTTITITTTIITTSTTAITTAKQNTTTTTTKNRVKYDLECP